MCNVPFWLLLSEQQASERPPQKHYFRVADQFVADRLNINHNISFVRPFALTHGDAERMTINKGKSGDDDDVRRRTINSPSNVCFVVTCA